MYSGQNGKEEFNCQSWAYIESIINSQYYDQVMKRWTHPGDISNSYITYCLADDSDEKSQSE